MLWRLWQLWGGVQAGVVVSVVPAIGVVSGEVAASSGALPASVCGRGSRQHGRQVIRGVGVGWIVGGMQCVLVVTRGAAQPDSPDLMLS